MSDLPLILDGTATAKVIRAEVADRVLRLKEQGINPGLAAVLADDEVDGAVAFRRGRA